MFCSHFTSHHSEFVYLNLLSSLLCQSHLVTYPYQFISLINQKGLKKIDLTLEEHRRSEEISSISPETKKSFYRKQHGKGFFLTSIAHSTHPDVCARSGCCFSIGWKYFISPPTPPSQSPRIHISTFLIIDISFASRSFGPPHTFFAISANA